MDPQCDLRFLIPYKKEQSIALLGSCKELEDCFRTESVSLTIFQEAPFKKDRKFDHVLIPVLTAELCNNLSDFLSDALLPEGKIFLGIGNRFSIERCLFWKKRKTPEQVVFLRWSQIKKLLRKGNLSVLQTFGIRNIESPQVLVSLDQNKPGKFYFHQMYYARSFFAAIGQKLAALISTLGFQRILFRYYGIVAVKNAGTNI